MTKKILIVEDDAVARKSMERLITAHPRLAVLEPSVVQAASGQQGLAVFVAERPDLIITDLFMPAMDGFTFCRSLREAPFGKDVPIIVVSGIYKDPTLAASLSDEVQAFFLPKPIETDALVDRLLACLGATGASLPSAAPALVAPELAAPEPALDLAGLGLPPEREAGAALPPAGWSVQDAEVAGPPAELAPAAPPCDDPHNPLGTGPLAERHVAQLIFDLADTDATGTLSLAYGKVKKDLYVRRGQVVAADSNLRREALGTLLCAKGIIDDGQLAYLLAETKARRHKMGAVLVELGWLTPEEVLQALAAQARKRITDCLRWDQGSFAFTPGDTFGDRIIEHDLDAANLVFWGLYRSATPESLVQRFDQKGACPVQLTQRFDRYREKFADVFGNDVGLILAGEPSIGSLSLRDDAHVVMAQVDTLIETGLATLGSPSQEIAVDSAALESSFTLERLGTEVNKRFDAIVQPTSSMSFADLRKNESPPGKAHPPFTRAVDESTSGALDIACQAPRGESPPPPSEDLRQLLLREYLMIHGKNHYDVLGIGRRATSAEIAEAVRAKLERFSPAAAARARLAPADLTRIDAVRAAITQAGDVLSTPARRAEYDGSLAAVQGAAGDPFGAELAFGEGMQLFQQERFDEALAKFESAVAARPDQALYHAYLGWADLLAHGPERKAQARGHLAHALALDPELADAHAMLGRIAATEDDAATARAHLERSLAIEPEQPDIVDLLIEAYARLPQPDPNGAERFLRRLVAALGERAEPLRKRLWHELGDLYENKLGDRVSARVAYDNAARLGPKNLESLRKAQTLNAEDPKRWRETAHALAAEWQLHPQEAAPALKVLALLREHGRQDGVAVTAAAMVLRGVADRATRQLAEEHRPKQLEQIAGELPADLWMRAGYRPEERELERLAETLVETGVLRPFERDELGLLKSDLPIPPAELPSTFGDVLAYVCRLYALDLPEAIISLPVLGGDARLGDLRPPALLCGNTLLGTEDSVELGFRLGRAMALWAPGRLAGSARSGGQLRPYFWAAMALANPSGSAQGPAAVEAAKAIARLDAESKSRILEAAWAIKQNYDSLNLTIWGRGLARVATRLALLVCGDLLRVGRAVAEEDGPAALDDLITFAVSLDYLDLRRELGFLSS